MEKRLQKSLQDRVDERLKKYNAGGKKSAIKVKVTNNFLQKHVIVWLGGSAFSCKDTFKSMVHTREQYMECGPSCCRFNSVFDFWRGCVLQIIHSVIYSRISNYG